VEGVWNEEEYHSIVRNYRPDHLALLPGAIGACSWEDGCGIRANKDIKKGGKDEVINNIRATARNPSYSGTETVSWADVDKTLEAFIDGYFKNTDAERPEEGITGVGQMPSAMKQWIASKSLLGDAGADTFAELVFFPVVNPSTDKLNEGALRAVISGRGAQADIPDTAKESAQDKARSLLDKEFGTELSAQQQLGFAKRLVHMMCKTLGIQIGEEELSHDDLRGQLQNYVDGLDQPPRQTEGIFNYVEEVFDDYFIYKEIVPGEAERFFKRDYRIVDGKVEIVGEPKEVVPKSEYVELSKQDQSLDSEDSEEGSENKDDNGKEVKEMADENRKERIEAILSAENGCFCENDQKFLEELPDEQFDKIESLVKAKAEQAEAKVNEDKANDDAAEVKANSEDTSDETDKQEQQEEKQIPKTPSGTERSFGQGYHG